MVSDRPQLSQSAKTKSDDRCTFTGLDVLGIALFLATVLQDVDTLETIVALTPSTKVRIKAAETLVKDLHASGTIFILLLQLSSGPGDRVRLYEVSEGLLFKQAPHLKRAVLNIIVNDNMQVNRRHTTRITFGMLPLSFA